MVEDGFKFQQFRENDLNDNGGKQFELGVSWCEFLDIPPIVGKVTIPLRFRALCKEHQSLDGRIVELTLDNINKRGDRKAYAGESARRSAIKDFFIDSLHLTTKNRQDYFAVYKHANRDASNAEYDLFFIPKPLYDNLISLFVKFSNDKR